MIQTLAAFPIFRPFPAPPPGTQQRLVRPIFSATAARLRPLLASGRAYRPPPCMNDINSTMSYVRVEVRGRRLWTGASATGSSAPKSS